MDIGARPTNPTQGTTRFNTLSSMVEVWDGANWMPISAEEIKKLTVYDMLQDAEDRIRAEVVVEHLENPTIVDAFNEWERANERFRVVLALAENTSTIKHK